MSKPITVTRQFVVSIWGVDESGYHDSLAEATGLINMGCIEGADANEKGGFRFSSTLSDDRSTGSESHAE